MSYEGSQKTIRLLKRRSGLVFSLKDFCDFDIVVTIVCGQGKMGKIGFPQKDHYIFISV